MESSKLKNLDNIKNVYFIGIGGSGMFPLAHILKEKGFNISGADIYESDTLQKVRALGIKVYTEHKESNINGQDLIVFSAAIKETNPEIIAAKKAGIPIIERSVMLGLIFNKYSNSIGVSGTHGKTTTTSMITSVLLDAGKEPTAVIGATLRKLGGNSCIGNSDIIVAEACEYVDSFLQLNPAISVITNVDADHLDYFGTLENVIKSFRKYALQTSKLVIYNGDSANAQKAVENITAKTVSFGLDENNDYYAKNISFGKMQNAEFDIVQGQKTVAHINLNVPGKHNIYNALAAYIVCSHLGVSNEDFEKSITEFKGAHRRFEILLEKDGITVADDFAHHPTEIESTLEAASKMGFKRVIAVFQPHTFSRTAMFKEEFTKALSIADEVIVSDILPVRETNTYGVKSTDLTDRIQTSHYIPTFEEICEYVVKNARGGDLILTLGGGNIYKCANMISENL
ncbi:MAG: UDP-N-acetylmuramate--L-alanine ligase [Clostridia bacterium]|nr:UDP-N-acetylmuramate--L-alanine ligase [Clostridia bacterium]